MILKPVHDTSQFFEMAQAQMGVFASPDWLQIYGEALQLIGIYDKEQHLIGGFCFLKAKKMGLNFIKLPPYTPHCNLFYRSDSKNTSAQLTFSKEIVQEVCEYLSHQKFAICVLAFPSTITDLQPFIWSGFKVVPNYTYRINLNQSLDQIQSHFDSKNRNAINKAIKENVEVIENHQSPELLYQFFKTHLIKAGANVYDAELKNIFHNFSKPTNSFALQALHNNKIIGTVFCIFDKHVCYYLLGGVDKEAGVQGINNLLILKCIEKAKLLGCEVFDFEGSMLKGVEKFFRSFGPQMVPYYTVNKANVFLEMALKFKKRSLF